MTRSAASGSHSARTLTPALLTKWGKKRARGNAVGVGEPLVGDDEGRGKGSHPPRDTLSATECPQARQGIPGVQGDTCWQPRLTGALAVLETATSTIASPMKDVSQGAPPPKIGRAHV